jgi:hypothetical protein
MMDVVVEGSDGEGVKFGSSKVTDPVGVSGSKAELGSAMMVELIEGSAGVGSAIMVDSVEGSGSKAELGSAMMVDETAGSVGKVPAMVVSMVVGPS